MSAASLLNELHQSADPVKAAFFPRFFKTGPGQYGEGDVFLGVTVPMIRRVIRGYRALALADIDLLLSSPLHEARLAGLLLLVGQSRAGDGVTREDILQWYLDRTDRVNNWDLVDASAPQIVGERLHERGDDSLLDALAATDHLWTQRIAMVATLAFIRHGSSAQTLRIAERFLSHPHDLIHKAAGWMLREMGKRDTSALRGFLDAHAATMPRTMLRSSMERLSEEERRRYRRR